jgi:pilus assembly protein CpaB
MNKRLLSVFIFAFVVAAGATILVYKLVSSRVTAGAKQPAQQVMVAARNLPVGTMLGDMDLKTSAWPGSLPAGAVLKKEDALGRGVVSSIYEGEPIIESRLATKGAGAGLAATIPPGMRAAAIRVNEVVGVAGFVVPGQRVDVLVLGVPPGNPGNTGTITKTILQNIQILSAGQNMQKDNEGKPITVQVVNVLVTPEQAETLSLISNDMRIQLILRNPLDTIETKTTGVAASNIFSGTTFKMAGSAAPASTRPRTAPLPVRVAVAAPPPVPLPIVVEVIQGTKRSELKFKDQAGQTGNSEVKQ